MYAFISGELVEAGPPTVVLAGGIGYELEMSDRSRLRLPQPGEPVRLYTHFQVREDAHSLYGFLDSHEREVFRSLLSVNGVGPKLALAIIGDEAVDRMLAAMSGGDITLLLKVKGVGRKTAERILVELRDRDILWKPAPLSMAAAAGRAEADGDDAVLALVSLGLTEENAQAALAHLSPEERADGSVEFVVRKALRHARL